MMPDTYIAPFTFGMLAEEDLEALLAEAEEVLLEDPEFPDLPHYAAAVREELAYRWLADLATMDPDDLANTMESAEAEYLYDPRGGGKLEWYEAVKAEVERRNP
jgi:hypothetical protein